MLEPPLRKCLQTRPPEAMHRTVQMRMDHQIQPRHPLHQPSIRWGRPKPPRSAFDALLDEVDEDSTDVEHVGVSVTHESGFSLSIHPGWRVVLDELDVLTSSRATSTSPR
jgi:hypothetical protein